jgi:hypothetical protein
LAIVRRSVGQSFDVTDNIVTSESNGTPNKGWQSRHGCDFVANHTVAKELQWVGRLMFFDLAIFVPFDLVSSCDYTATRSDGDKAIASDPLASDNAFE